MTWDDYCKCSMYVCIYIYLPCIVYLYIEIAEDPYSSRITYKKTGGHEFCLQRRFQTCKLPIFKFPIHQHTKMYISMATLRSPATVSKS